MPTIKKEVRDFINELSERTGRKVEEKGVTGSGHIKISVEGIPKIFPISKTPSDYRSYKNSMEQIISTIEKEPPLPTKVEKPAGESPPPPVTLAKELPTKPWIEKAYECLTDIDALTKRKEFLSLEIVEINSKIQELMKNLEGSIGIRKDIIETVKRAPEDHKTIMEYASSVGSRGFRKMDLVDKLPHLKATQIHSKILTLVKRGQIKILIHGGRGKESVYVIKEIK